MHERATVPPDPPPGRPQLLTIDDLRLHVLAYVSTAHQHDASRPPLLLLHGGMAHARWWDLVAPQLADVARPFAFDRRGHGDSDWTEVERYGWNVLFPCLVGMAVLGALCLVPALRADARARVAT